MLDILSVKVALAVCGLLIAWAEWQYIAHVCSKDTPLSLRLGSSMQAAGAALFIFNPCLCGALVVAGRSIFAWNMITGRIGVWPPKINC